MKSESESRPKLLDIIDGTMLHFIKINYEEAKEILSDSGLELEKEKAFGIKSIRKLKFMMKATSNQRDNSTLLEIAVNKLKEYVNDHLDKPSEVLIAMLRERAPHVQFRSLDKLGDHEIREILSDIDLVRFMEEIEGDQEG